MAVDRPTFDENWHRVAELRPRLRSIVQVHRQHYGGQRWHVLRDPGNNQSFRLDESAYAFVALLDGRQTVAEAWKTVGTQLGDMAPTQGECIRLLGQMYVSNLLHGELPPDAVGMFQRMKRRKHREVGGYFMNVMFLKIPLFDPDRILDKLTPMFGWMFGPVGLIGWVLLVGYALFNMAGQGERLFSQAQGILDPRNLVWLYACFVGIKIVHEFGHGIACKRFGQYEGDQGEVHTLGIMLLVLMPVPYVDASSSWVFRQKWHRVFVGAAGMYVELAVAAVAALVWLNTAEGHLIHALAYNVMFIGSVSTVLFNANPLLRFDGYYILSDLIEMPNLNQRSKNYLYYLVQKYVYGVRNPQNPAHSRSERISFVLYGVLSFVYRVVICVGIILFVGESLFFVGMLMAAVSMVAWVLVPLGKFVHYLLIKPELDRTRGRAVGITLATLVLLVVAIGYVPLPFGVRAAGVIEAREQVTIYAEVDGRIISALPSGSQVAAQDVLMQLEDERLTAEYARLQALHDETLLRLQQAMTREPALAQVFRVRLDAVDAQLARAKRELDALQIKPSTSGQWVSLNIDQRRGGVLKRGELAGVVATLDELIVKVAADQWNGPRLIAELDRTQPAEIRIDGKPDATFTGMVERIASAGVERMPSPALSMAAGGTLMPDEEGRSQQATAEPIFEIELDLDLPKDSRFLPGQRVQVRFPMADRSLAVQTWLYLRQMVQQRWAW